MPALVERHDPRVIAAVVGAYVLTMVVQAFAQRTFQVMTGRIGQDVVLDLRRRVFDRFQRLSVAFHERYTSGRVVSRQTSDVEAISELFEEGIDGLVRAVLSLVTVGAGMLILDVPLALVALLSFPALLWISAWFRRESAAAYRRTREAVVLVIIQFVETMGGIRAVQAFRREPRNSRIFARVNGEYRDALFRSSRLNAVFAPGISFVGNLTTGVVLFLGGYLAIRGSIEVGVLAGLYLRRFFDPLEVLAHFYNSFQSAAAGLEKLTGVLEEEPSVPDPVRPVALPVSARGEVRVEGVRFGYDAETVLPGLDLVIPAGQTVAVVGATGAGKTTLARLLSRFYDPREGRVLLDGVDLREIDDPALRGAVVTVTQESFLFAGSVADNIGFGRPGSSRADIVDAARAIGAHEFITALPDGYDTGVHARGGRLSAGQRQLVSFARVFLTGAAVLVLDEATSSLDIPAERAVQRAMRTVLAGRTAVVIAHRLSTVEIADRVLVMDGGQIVDYGPPGQLISGSGRYAELYEQWLARSG
ncbi:MAG: ABC transporter ATP-binding protein [Streptosporangiaceae bacterium]